MKPTIVWMTAITGAALVMAGAAARRSGPAPKEAPRSLRQSSVAAPREEEPAPVQPPAEVCAAVPRESEFWGGLELLLEPKTGPGGAEIRRAVIERTLRYLGWAASRRLAFASAAEAAAQEVEAAWAVREAQISDDPDEAVHERYVEYKRLALARIEQMLDPSREPERLLQERLEEWFDAIR